MNEFTHHTPDGDAGAVDLNMDGLHDFGEGVGVDMRDFTSHADDETKEGMNGASSCAALRRAVWTVWTGYLMRTSGTSVWC